MRRKAFWVVAFIFASFFVHVIVSSIDVFLDLRPAMEAQASTVNNGIMLPFPNVTGIHMVNDETKLGRILSKNKNFELDAFYINDDFYIAHNRNDIGDTTLSDLLSSNDLSNSYVWLDLKDSVPDEKSLSERLEEVIADTGFSKDRLIVEASTEFLKELSDAGFYTAFTPPFNKKMTEEERNRVIRETELLIKETGVVALEGNINQYVMLRDYFPEMDKIVHFARPYVEVRKNMLIKNIGKDPKVKFFVVEEH